ncbi:MAG TPA: molybdopterin-dependent oxidoreductase [Thermoanaerobaculia bacterium]|nr:molybdopterin-dependent oxidoreductase [Thermoanaerobaculia bacterium]
MTNVTRRNLLKLAGGAAIGFMASPMPWRLTDELAIWTQNWSWIPVPPKGEVTTRMTACSLCPSGCAVQARCIGGLPVSLRAPAGSAALCSLGLTGHHLPYHPARLLAPVRVTERADALHTNPVRLGEVVTETAAAIAAAKAGLGTVAVLDMRPGRSISWAWRSLLSGLPGGAVIAGPGREGASLATLERMLAIESGSLGLDFEHARTIVSFGAPLADGWGSPRTLQRLLGGSRGNVRLIHVDPLRSPTAEIADRWLPARPGTEAVLALGLAHVLIAENLVDRAAAAKAVDFERYSLLVSRVTAEKAAAVTGIAADAIIATAREIARAMPAVVLAGEDAGGGRFGRAAETAILGLNLILGNAGKGGGFLARPDLPAPFDSASLAPVQDLDQLPDRSVALLLIDASAGDAAFPWRVVERKLIAKGGLVVALSPFFAGTARHANLIVPAPTFLEAMFELPAGFDAPAATLGISAPLIAAREGGADPASFVRAVAAASRIDLPGAWARSEDLIKARVARIHRVGRGSVMSIADGAEKPLAAVATPDALLEALMGGAKWEDAPSPSVQSMKTMLLGDAAGELERISTCATAPKQSPQYPLTLLPRAPRDATASAVVSPVITKLYRESVLRRSPETAVLNPATARELRLRAGRKASLETAAGAIGVTIATSGSVMPGAVEIAVSPGAIALGDMHTAVKMEILEICAIDESGGWRQSAARLVEA